MTNNYEANPDFSGKVQDGLNNPIGKIYVWKEIDPMSEKSPIYYGKIVVDGVTYRLSLWKFVPFEPQK